MTFVFRPQRYRNLSNVGRIGLYQSMYRHIGRHSARRIILSRVLPMAFNAGGLFSVSLINISGMISSISLINAIFRYLKYASTIHVARHAHFHEILPGYKRANGRRGAMYEATLAYHRDFGAAYHNDI